MGPMGTGQEHPHSHPIRKEFLVSFDKEIQAQTQQGEVIYSRSESPTTY
jgi:hypothetical protein